MGIVLTIWAAVWKCPFLNSSMAESHRLSGRPPRRARSPSLQSGAVPPSYPRARSWSQALSSSFWVPGPELLLLHNYNFITGHFTVTVSLGLWPDHDTNPEDKGTGQEKKRGLSRNPWPYHTTTSSSLPGLWPMAMTTPATPLAEPWPHPRTLGATYSGGRVSGPRALCREIRSLAKALKQCFL